MDALLLALAKSIYLYKFSYKMRVTFKRLKTASYLYIKTGEFAKHNSHISNDKYIPNEEELNITLYTVPSILLISVDSNIFKCMNCIRATWVSLSSLECL